MTLNNRRDRDQLTSSTNVTPSVTASPQVEASDDDLLVTLHAATVLKCSERTLERKRRDGTGPAYIVIDGLVRYQRRDLKQYIASRRVTSRTEAESRGLVKRVRIASAVLEPADNEAPDEPAADDTAADQVATKPSRAGPSRFQRAAASPVSVTRRPGTKIAGAAR